MRAPCSAMLRATLLATALTAPLLAQRGRSGASEPTEWPVATALRADLEAVELADAYDTLRNRLGQAARLYGVKRGTRAFAELMADPLRAPESAIAWTDRVLAAGGAGQRKPGPPDLPSLLEQAADLRDLDATGLRIAEDGSDVSNLEERLELAVFLMEEAKRELDAALEKVPEARHAEVDAAAVAALQAFVETVYVPARKTHDQAWRELFQHVDQAAVVRATGRIAPLLQAEFWKPVIKEARKYQGPKPERLEGVTGRLVAARETSVGWVVIGNRYRNSYDGALDTALIVDLGGDDTYASRCSHAAGPARPLALVVDLNGDDRYGDAAVDEATESAEATAAAATPYGGPASGVLGVGAVVDLRGDDVYAAGGLGCGAGMLGAGILIDLAGDDRYSGDVFCQGAGILGVGLCLDQDGSDEMTAAMYSQGFAGPHGYGLLFDRAGADRRTATGKYPSSYGTAGEFQGMSQGAAVGWRRLQGDGEQIAGGFGLLVDGGGDDVSVVGEFGYGMGYFLGTGIVREAGGNDQVDASRYGIATGAHQACGLVLDDAGDDIYINPHTASIAGNWDGMVSILVDAQGDDRYQGGGITTGSATITSFAALLDGDGRDTYLSGGGLTAFGSCGHAFDIRNKTRCVALFADLGGDEDVYPASPQDPKPANGMISVRRKTDAHEDKSGESGVGLFLDR